MELSLVCVCVCRCALALLLLLLRRRRGHLALMDITLLRERRPLRDTSSSAPGATDGAVIQKRRWRVIWCHFRGTAEEQDGVFGYAEVE